jgi:IS5 family transposase
LEVTVDGVGGGKVPDAKTMGRWGLALGPAAIAQIHDRIVHTACAERVVQGKRMRIDATVVETNIHYPTDSSLLGDGVRVLGANPHDEENRRHRRNRRRQAARGHGSRGRPGQALSREIAAGVKRAADPRRQLRLAGLRQQLERMLPRVGQVMRPDLRRRHPRRRQDRQHLRAVDRSHPQGQGQQAD